MTLELSVTVGGGVKTVRMKVLHTIPFVDSLRRKSIYMLLCRLVVFRRILARVNLKGMLELGNSVLSFHVFSQRISLLKTGLLMSHERINAWAYPKVPQAPKI